MSQELPTPEVQPADPATVAKEGSTRSGWPARAVRALKTKRGLAIGIAAGTLALLLVGIGVALLLQQRHVEESQAGLRMLIAQEATAQQELLDAKAEAGELLTATTEPSILEDPTLLDELRSQLDATPDLVATDLPPLGTITSDADFQKYEEILDESIEVATDAVTDLTATIDAVTDSIVAKARSLLGEMITAAEGVYAASEGKVPDDAVRTALRDSLDAAAGIRDDEAATADDLAAAKADLEEKTAAVQAAATPAFESLLGVYRHSVRTWSIGVSSTALSLADCGDEFCETEGLYTEITGQSWDGTCYVVTAVERLEGDPGYRGDGISFRLCPKGHGGPGDDSKDRVIGIHGYLVGTDTFYRTS